MFLPLATKWEIINFTMNNPGQCVVPLFVISLDKLAAATYYELYTLLAFSIHSALMAQDKSPCRSALTPLSYD